MAQGEQTTEARPALLRALAAGLAGGIAWIGGIMLFFGSAQSILSNPDFQSEKFLYVVGQLEPLPRAVEAPWILLVGILVIGLIYGVVYHYIRGAFGGKRWWKRGLLFGAMAWALMVPWFEFYLPWNVMHEPPLLVLVETGLWLAVLSFVGLAIAGVYEWRIPEDFSEVGG